MSRMERGQKAKHDNTGLDPDIHSLGSVLEPVVGWDEAKRNPGMDEQRM